MSSLREIRAEETRSRLLGAARELFTEHGYAHTTTEQLVQRAGVTRGALYHHFESKLAIFDALLIELEQGFIATVRRIASPDAPAWTNLVTGCHAFLDSCLRPDVQRLALIDGPAVLGPARWREIEDQYALVPVLNGLTGSMSEGTVAPRPPESLARMLLAAINEAGLIIAQSPRPREARQEADDAFDALLHGLRRAPGSDAAQAR